MLQSQGSPRNLDRGPAFTRAQTGVSVLGAAIRGLIAETEDADGDRARQRRGWPAGRTTVPTSRKVADAIRHLSGSKPRGAEGE